MVETLKRTPLYQQHVEAGAKMVPFAGYEMPVQYRPGILSEHKAVRERVGLFDVSHMGELFVRGSRALDFVNHVTTNDASKLALYQAQYSTICNDKASILDDCIVYRLENEYMIVVNASNRDKDRDWIQQFAGKFGIELVDRSDEMALLALQGPQAQQVLARITSTDLEQITYYASLPGEVAGRRAL